MRSSNWSGAAAVLAGVLVAASLGACGSSASVPRWSISGTVSGAMSQGVTLTLGGAASATTTSDAAGHYAFSGLADGTYTVVPSAPGFAFTPGTLSITVLGADVSGQDFTCEHGTYAISGAISGAVRQGVSVRIVWWPKHTAVTTTDESGRFTFAGLAEGSYYLTPTLDGYSFSPEGRSVAVSVADVTGQDFVAFAGTGAYTSFQDGPRAVVQLVDASGWYCSGTAFVGNRSAAAPVHVIAAGHCTGITFADEVLADAPNAAGITAHFNGFADAPAGELFSKGVKVIRYSTMWGHDLALLELDATQEELAALGVSLPTLAAAPPAGGAVFTHGYRVDDQRMRRVDCLLGPRVWVKESVWSWMSAFRGECPVTYIRAGASGSPVFAQDTSELFGVVNTVSEDLPAPTCALNNPCEISPAGAENVPLRAYFQDATRLKGCFTADGVFDRALAGCRLPSSTFSLQPVEGQPTQLAVVANGPGVAAGAYRYKVTPLETFDPADASGYGAPTTAPVIGFAPPAQRFVVAAVSEADFDPLGIEPLALHLAVFWE